MRNAARLAAALLCASCPPPGPTLDSFCSQYVDQVCARLAECNGASAAAWCTLVQRERFCAEVAASERVGNTRYHADYAKACLTIVASLPCRVLTADGQSGELDVHCSETVEGRVGQSNACTANRECQRDLACDRSASRCPGLCRRLRDAGESCDELTGVRCATGLACVDGTCGLPLDAGVACFESRDCDTGLFCDPFLAPQACGPLRGVGPCRQDEADCAPRSACTSDAGCAPARQEGEGCTVGRRECNVLLTCVDGGCQRWGVLGDGCGELALGESAGCLVGGCSYDAGAAVGTCVELDAGASCESNAVCGRGGECLGTPRVCVPRCASR